MWLANRRRLAASLPGEVGWGEVGYGRIGEGIGEGLIDILPAHFESPPGLSRVQLHHVAREWCLEGIRSANYVALLSIKSPISSDFR